MSGGIARQASNKMAPCRKRNPQAILNGSLAYSLRYCTLTSRNGATPRLSERVKGNRQYDDYADDNLLIVGGDVHDHETVEQYPDQNRSNHRSEHASQAAEKAGTADYHRGNNPQFKSLASHRFRGIEERSFHKAGQASQETHNRI